MKKAECIVLITLAILLLVSPCVNAGYLASQREKLSNFGKEGIIVLVERLNPVAEELGTTIRTIQNDIELGLRTAGIKVWSWEEVEKSGKMLPYLSLSMSILFPKTTLGKDTSSAVYNIRITADRFVFFSPDTKANACFASVWKII